MLLKQFKNLKPHNFIRHAAKNFTSAAGSHFQVAVVGAGTGGVSVAKQLQKNASVDPSKILILDKSAHHYYQPGYTKIAGGVIESNFVINNFVKYNTADITKGLTFKMKGVSQIDPDNNSISTEDGSKFTYDHLVIAAGLQTNLDSIPGLKEQLDDPSSNVGTIYDYHNCFKVAKMRESFKGGRALFTQAPAPLKCAGAPQKILYLCDDYWKKHNISGDLHFFTPLHQMFSINYFSDSLGKIVREKGITPHFETVLTSVEKGAATFKNVKDNSTFTESFDFLHAVPHLAPPEFMKNSGLTNAAGFVDVGRDMRHKKYGNIWAVGDCISLPQSKTAAAVFSQVPNLVHNLSVSLNHKRSGTAIYDGYSSCPIYTKKGSLLLAEFKEYPNEKGEVQREIDESFDKGKQQQEKALYYYITYMMTYFYRLGLMGKWYGKHSFYNPVNKNGEKRDLRSIYKPGLYLLAASPLLFAILL